MPDEQDDTPNRQLDDRAPAADTPFPIVGIGASAGGLDAFQGLLEALPADSGIAFLLIQHLDPTHDSVMADLLDRHCKMPVRTAADDMRIAADTVYVIPSNRYLRVLDRTIVLEHPAAQRGVRMPIDYCFRSLAETLKERAVGIVLTGTASDGTAGLREIKAMGGLTLVQDPETAEYDSMPRSAIRAGVADFVAPIAGMPELLARYAGHPFIVAPDTDPVSDEEPAAFQALLRLLRNQTDHDFSCYRPATLNRRIRRRMGLAQAATMRQYLDRLRQDREEVQNLAGDLLIGVTRFFRDPEAWDLLAETVIRPLISRPNGGQNCDLPLRVWVAGCSSGEEAVSVAILLAEAFEHHGIEPQFQIFATDIDQRAVDAARETAFPASIADDVAPERLKRYFIEENGRYVLGRRLRECILFARHDLITDPPFSKLDLVICRNVMIYLESQVQNRLLRMFHFALKQGGHLFLGSSETVGKQAQFYETLAKEWRIYRRVGEQHSERVTLPQPPLDVQGGVRVSNSRASARMHSYQPSSVDLAKNAMISRFVPASILVNQRNDAIYFHGPVRDYLDFPSGEPTRDVTLMALDGLRTRMRATLKEAFESCEVQTTTAHRMRRAGREVTVRITAEPVRLQNDQWAVLLYLEDIGEPRPVEPLTEVDLDEQSAVQRLEFDLQVTRDELTTAVEQLEASNEELRASNQEIMSMNEELQSSNEELETSREELQSMNEELSTVNNQLENKIVELERVNNDISNLINSTQLAVLFLDKALVIRRFTPTAAGLLRILDSDIGRPVSDLSVRVNDPTLYENVEKCVRTLTPLSAHVRGVDGRWFHRQVLPYRTSDSRIEGVLITYADISELYRETELRGTRERQQRAVASIGRIGLTDAPLSFLFDAAVRCMVDGLNCGMAKVLRHRPEQHDLLLVAQRGFRDVEVNVTTLPDGGGSQGGYTLSAAQPVVVVDLPNDTRFEGPELLTRGGVRSGISVLIGTESDPWGVLGVHSTEIKQFSDDDVAFVQAVAHVLHGVITNSIYKQQLLESSERLRLALDAGRIATWNWDPRSDLAQWDDRVYTLLGLKPGEIPPSVEKFHSYIHPDDRDLMLREQTKAVEQGAVFDVEFRIIDSAGRERWLVSKGKMFTERADGPRLIGLSYDITDLKQSSTRLATLLAELDHRVQNMLTVMGSIVNLADKEEHVASFKANLRQRLLSLARTHSMLSNAQFDGASLRTRIIEECAPYSAKMVDRVRFEGQDMRLNPQAAQTLGMAIHEMVTNSLKYGALSTESGVISVHTENTGDRMIVEWSEIGGPPVSAPSEFGFGVRVIRDLVEYELNAKVTLDFQENGMVCHFDLPLEAIEHSLD